MSEVKEHCGLFGVYGCEDAAEKGLLWLVFFATSR